MITDRDVTDEVKAALGTDVDGFDVPAIVDALREQFGPFAETDKLDVEHDDFWALVWKHTPPDHWEPTEPNGIERTGYDGDLYQVFPHEGRWIVSREGGQIGQSPNRAKAIELAEATIDAENEDHRHEVHGGPCPYGGCDSCDR